MTACDVCQQGIFGGSKNKTIFKSVPESVELMRGSMKDVVFALDDGEGREFQVKGAYLIADGGFHKIACLVDPNKTEYTTDCIRWSERRGVFLWHLHE